MTAQHDKAQDQIDAGEVETDQRALVRKVLARYSTDFATFRELLQNADDAESKVVTICFESDSNKQPSDMIRIVKWTLTNTGKPFEERDWDRLKKIASGNTDSTKVGAFGVGFYTVFSVTDCPVVLSGGRKMEFFWESEDGPLRFRKSSYSTNKTGVVIEIPLRKPPHTLKVNDLLKFLATSITFMTKLEEVQVSLDTVCIGHIRKAEQTGAESIELPVSLKHANVSNMMTITPLSKLQRSPITIQYVDSAHRELKLKLSIFTIAAKIGMVQEFSEELSRCILKEQDRLVKYSLIFTGNDAYDQSSMDREHESIFQGLRANLDGEMHSMIFIGHATQQTTGIGGHMASQFIPTLERDSIDLFNRYIAVWNNELLYLGGFLSRSIYELELSDIQAAWMSKASDFAWLRKRFIHVLKFFTFHPTAPSTKVGEKLRESFYTCTPSHLRLLSSVGVCEVSDIRLFDPLCEKFLKDVPMLSSDINDLAVNFVKAHPDRPDIKHVAPSDVEKDLRSYVLDGSNGELVAFLQWIHRKWTTGAAYLKDVAHFRDASGNEIPLSSIQHFIDPKGHGRHIPQKSPLPRTVMPRQIAETITSTMLQQFRWKEFTIVDWIRHISDDEVTAKSEYNFARSAKWAECVLHSMSSAWSSGGDVHEVAKSVFSRVKCIPTTHDLRMPDQSCLPSSHVTKFDFPMVQFPSNGEISRDMEQLLVALGVRKHPPFRLFLEQEVSLKTSDLIDHLVQVDAATGLSDQEIKDLRSSPVFSRKSTRGYSERGFCLDQLYPSIEIFRQLGLPLIDWGGDAEWKDESRAEVKLLYRLGLRRSPPLEEIITLCSEDTDVRGIAFEYLCANIQSEYSDYNPSTKEFQSIAFVPAEIKGCKDGLRKLGEVFLDKRWKPCGFPVVRSGCQESILEELGIQRHPPSSSILQKLKEIEKDQNHGEETARELLPILGDHVSRFEKDQLDDISRLRIVPATTPEGQKMVAPVECYLEKRTKHDLYSQLFNFVDFGNGEIFMRACGAKNEPTEEEVAIKLISDPKKFYDIAEQLKPERGRFLQELLDLASRQTRISNGTINKMKTHSVLLGERPNPEYEHCPLWKPSEIFIVDNVHTFDLFKDPDIVTAPRKMPRELEEFYVLLGCQPMTTAIRDQINSVDEKENPEMGFKYREFILGRLPIFLYSYPHLRPGAPQSCFDGANDMTVRFWKKLFISKTLTVRNGSEVTTPERPVSATATYKYEDKMIELWLTYEMKKDVHDLAVSLCRVFLGSENRPDVEFLTTCLSGEPRVLKQRGYQLDEKSQSQQCLNDWKFAQSLIDTIPSVTANLPVADSMAQLSVTEMKHDSAITHPEQHTTNQSRLFGSNQLASSSRASLSTPSPVNAQAIKGKEGPRKVLSSIKSATGPFGIMAVMRRQSLNQVMPRKHIRTTVEAAIQGSKPGPQIPRFCNDDPIMKNFMKNGYCDVINLRLFHQSEMQDVKVYIAPDTDANTNTMSMEELLKHFLEIIKPIAVIYDLTTESFCAFYPTTAGSIAFNHEGTLYLNLQYFKEWHYEDVRNDNQQEALTFWFLTFAHEIAHNLIKGHDAEHEFWFLAICEQNMDKFLNLLGSASV